MQSPWYVASGGQYLFVVQYPSNPGVYRIDKRTGASEVVSASPAFDVRVSPDGLSVYWSSGAGGTISRRPVDLSQPTQVLATITPDVLEILPLQGVLYASHGDGRVTRIDLTNSGLPQTTISQSFYLVEGLSKLGETVLFSDRVNGYVLSGIGANATPQQRYAGMGGRRTHADETYAYATSFDGYVYRAPIAGGSLESQPLTVGDGSFGNIVSNQTQAYVVDSKSGRILRWPKVPGAGLVTLVAGLAEPVMATLDGNVLYFTERGAGRIMRLVL